ncbi:magnesium transporter CorA [Flavobacterium sp. xlx-214]|uniref:magnesium transporter CorA family protein n=1 Tax=unclassified Flavobacterium TaxID=196869 RepID=UPI0013D4E364|nr:MULTISPECIES: CorA family divalent cation transporter [unclassified Flavobacterium]MBA5791891.1 magnesium transporter CorA [Flavobacterium sp. xlx-221]QMI83125.1 magnesium transporter CorA [Flavobacterium sp. xlx-214]
MAIESILKNEHCEWLDVEMATKDDLAMLHSRYDINNLLLEDTIDPNHLPKYEEVDGVKFFLMRENTNLERQTFNTISDVSTKLSMFVFPNLIITIHRMKSKSIHEVIEKIKKQPKLKETITPDQLALKLALQVMKTYDDESLHLMEVLDNVENEIFLKNNNKTNQIRRLYKLKRMSGLNTRILNISSEWINKFHALKLENVEVMDLIDKQKDVLADFDHLNAQTTNLISMFLALSDQKANQVMKLLAMFSVYFLPLTFIAGVYGMNFDNMPELKYPYGYYGTLGVMALIVIVTFIYFKRKKW